VDNVITPTVNKNKPTRKRIWNPGAASQTPHIEPTKIFHTTTRAEETFSGPMSHPEVSIRIADPRHDPQPGTEQTQLLQYPHAPRDNMTKRYRYDINIRPPYDTHDTTIYSLSRPSHATPSCRDSLPRRTSPRAEICPPLRPAVIACLECPDSADQPTGRDLSAAPSAEWTGGAASHVTTTYLAARGGNIE